MQETIHSHLDSTDLSSPLNAEELQVLRAQYEKEGEYVGLQTKFNYAWVRTGAFYEVAYLAYRFFVGSDQVKYARRAAGRRSIIVRNISKCARAKTGMPLLPRAWQL